jgi:nucleoside phosphorylase
LKESFLKELPEAFLLEEGFNGEFNDENIDKYLKEIQKKALKNRSEFEKELCNLFNYKQKKLKDQIRAIEKEKSKIQNEIESLKKELEQLSENKVKRDFIKEFTGELMCTIHKGGMVSGSAVVADGKIVEDYIEQRGIEGIDMEAYGVAFACSHHPNKPEVLILKAICDFADEAKNDIYQTAAAYVSAQVFHKLFTEVIEVE